MYCSKPLGFVATSFRSVGFKILGVEGLGLQRLPGGYQARIPEAGVARGSFSNVEALVTSI